MRKFHSCCIMEALDKPGFVLFLCCEKQLWPTFYTSLTTQRRAVQMKQMRSTTGASKPGPSSSKSCFHTYIQWQEIAFFSVFGPFIAFPHTIMASKTDKNNNLKKYLHSSCKAAEARPGCSGISCDHLFKSRHTLWIKLRSVLWLWPSPEPLGRCF